MWGFFSAVLGLLNRRDQVRERRSKEDAARPFGKLRYLPLDSDGLVFTFEFCVHNPSGTPIEIDRFEVEKPKGAVLRLSPRPQPGEARPMPGHAGTGQSVPVLWEVGLPETERSAFAAATSFAVELPEKRRLPWIRRKSETLICVVLKGRHKSAAAPPVQIRAKKLFKS